MHSRMLFGCSQQKILASGVHYCWLWTVVSVQLLSFDAFCTHYTVPPCARKPKLMEKNIKPQLVRFWQGLWRGSSYVDAKRMSCDQLPGIVYAVSDEFLLGIRVGLSHGDEWIQNTHFQIIMTSTIMQCLTFFVLGSEWTVEMRFSLRSSPTR